MAPLIKKLVMVPFTLLFLLSSPREAPAETVILSAMHYPPYEFAEPVNGLRGFDLEVIEAAFKRVQISAEFKFAPWKRVLEHTKRGLFTGVLSCVHSVEREDSFLFSAPTSQSTDAFFVRADFDGFKPTSIEDMAERKVGTVLGFIHEKIMKDAGANLSAYPSDELALKGLLNGRVDYLFLPVEFTLFRANQLGISNDMRFHKIRQKNLHLCFSRKWPDIEKIVEKFNEGLAAVRADGTYEAIHDKYR